MNGEFIQGPFKHDLYTTKEELEAMTLKGKGYKSSQEDWVAYSERIRAVADKALDDYNLMVGAGNYPTWKMEDALEIIFQMLSPDDDERGVLLRAKMRLRLSHQVPEGFVCGELPEGTS